jgi:hypothetical protein
MQWDTTSTAAEYQVQLHISALIATALKEADHANGN